MGVAAFQSLEAWFAHVPGLKVVAPSSAVDAKRLIRASIQDDSPVVFVEHRGLYFRQDAEGLGFGDLALGKAHVVREGTDVTLVSYSRMLAECLAAAHDLADQGVSVEVIDLRSLVPLDIDTIVGSVRKTNRLAIAHEAVVQGGLGAEIAAEVQETAMDFLDAPILRIGAPYAPPPASLELEKAFVPNRAAIVARLTDMLNHN